MRETVDIVVIGGGAMGSAAAWQAAKRGKSVILLEQFAAGHHQGASHGATRNFNEAYPSDDYLGLVTEARGYWDELSSDEGRPLIDQVGLVNHGWIEPLRAVRAGHERHGIASEFLSPAEAASRWQGLRFRSDVLYIPSSGRVRAADALAALRTNAERHFARFLYDSPVRSVEVVGPDAVVVTTDAEEYLAKRVVVTAGAWTSKVLAGLVSLPRMVVTEEHPAHFQPRSSDTVWPSFNHTPDPDVADDDYWFSQAYGMLTPGEGIKAGWHGVGDQIDPDLRPHSPVPAQISALRRYADEWLPGVDPDRFDVISCTYTMTATEDFILDRSGPIIVGAGFSGHGFKFTPAIGRVLVDLADGIPAPARFRGLGQRAETA